MQEPIGPAVYKTYGRSQAQKLKKDPSRKKIKSTSKVKHTTLIFQVEDEYKQEKEKLTKIYGMIEQLVTKTGEQNESLKKSVDIFCLDFADKE